MKKILYLAVDNLYVGGVTNMLLGIYNELIKTDITNDYDIKILVASDYNIDKLDPSIQKNIVVKHETYYRRFEILKARKFLKENTDNSFLFISFYSSSKLIFVSKIFNIKFHFCNRYSGHIPALSNVLKMDSKFLKARINLLLFRIMIFFQRYVKYGIFLSEKTKEYHVNKYNLKAKNTVVITNFVAEKYIAKKVIKNSDNEIHINSRISNSKGLSQVIEIAKGLREKKIKFVIKIFGDDKGHEVFAKKLLDEVMANKLTEYVKFMGSADVSKTLPTAKMLLSLSQAEGCPNNILEALVVGVPVVAYDCQVGPKEIIVENFNGKLVELNNKEKMINAINDAFEHTWDNQGIKVDAINKYGAKNNAHKYYEFIKFFLAENKN